MFHLFIRTLSPILILGVCGFFAWQIFSSRPEPVRLQQPRPRVAVEGLAVQPTRFEVFVRSQGTVQPRVASTLVAEVSGVVRSVSPSLRSGGFFSAGETLVKLDDTNYRLAVTSAEARVAQARAALEQELAQAEVVAEDWKRLGREAPALGLRKPQIAAAQAELAAAEAALERAKVDLARTRLSAPYDGRARELQVDVGQFMNIGTTAARIYATDVLEVRLPVAPDDVPFLELPEQFTMDSLVSSDIATMPKVTLETQLGPERQTWNAYLARVESAFDEASRQLYVIAEIPDPYRLREEGDLPLRVGQFATADIQGRVMEDVFVVPRRALRDNAEVLVVNAEGVIERRPVRVVWNSETVAVIDQGLKAGDIVSLTRIDVVTEGTLVELRMGSPTPRGGWGEATLPETESAATRVAL